MSSTQNVLAATETPVVFFIFNRPELTRHTFEAIRKAQPARLYVIADGPRDMFLEDARLCEDARKITEEVDWPCEVIRITAEQNLGLKERISGGLNQVFQREERAIILEDDCLAHPHFFRFCDQLLERFEDNPDVWTIGGSNFLHGVLSVNSSYYFSRYNHCWGWATWKRAWQAYDGEISFWPEWQSSDRWRALLPDKVERSYWEDIFDRVYRKQVNSWAYPWTASVWYHEGLTVTPAVNLVKNIGFGEDATHTRNHNQSVETGRILNENGLDHPEYSTRMEEADLYVFNHFFGGKNLRFPRNLLYYPWVLLNRLLHFFKSAW
ncbi:MAG: glycosyltransferase family 2 protein [Balneolaceae bacterium]|nr:MAG: glycosyltransferase family 2 protein [Balneolaceae bacterium]